VIENSQKTMLNQKQKKAFTLIELLVVIAIIGILATLAVVALQQARSRARDSKRMADMKQVQTALELFFNENGRYPTTEEWNSGSIVSSTSQETFMYSIPTAPSPADGDCLEASNTYTYVPQNDGASYTIDFCTGKQVSDMPDGAKQMTPGGIIFGSSGSAGELPESITCFSNPESCSWGLLGETFYGDKPKMDVDNGIVYVAYTGGNYELFIKRYVGGSWETIVNGYEYNYGGFYNGVLFDVDNGVPYIAFQDGYNLNRAIVLRYYNSSWEVVGGNYVSTGQGNDITLRINNNIPYVSLVNAVSYTIPVANVYKYQGGSWQNVGSPDFYSDPASLSLYIDNGTPYVSFSDSSNSYKLSTMKFDGSSWVYVGNQYFSINDAYPSILSVNSGKPYVAFRDQENSYKMTVMSYDGSLWNFLGNRAFTSVMASTYYGLDFYDGVPYIALIQSGGVFVYRYINGAWEIIQSSGLPSSSIDDVSFVISGDNAFLTYRDYSDYIGVLKLE